VGDGLLLVIAALAAYWLRFELELGGSINQAGSNLAISAFASYYMVSYVALALVGFQVRGLYALPRGASWLDHLRVIAGASLIATSLLVLGSLLFNAVLPSRLLFIFLLISTASIFGVERFLYRRLRVWIWRRGVNIRRVLVVGAGAAGQRIMKNIVEHADLGYDLVGYVTEGAEVHRSATWRVPIIGHHGRRLHRLGDLEDVQEVISNPDRPLHEVIVALPATHHAEILSIVDSCRECGIEFRLVPDLFEMRFNEVRIDTLNHVPLIGVKDTALRGFNLFLKRAIDLFLAACLLTVAAIPMLVIAAIIRVGSPGPVLFRQSRVGKGGRVFTCYKFRSMYEDAEKRLEELRHLNEASGPLFKMRDDPRITPAGKLLRRSSLDELPQLFNILRGDMSWVGPRPPMPREVAEYDDWHHKRLDVTPGLTGLWQVSGRSNLSFDEMVKLDLYYADSWSLALDLTIILRTVPVLLKREGAY
jgi:exopolysaccharide biosynthesis polyprenyl glycosylphosphotransferase